MANTYGWPLSENIEDLRSQPGAPDPFQDYAAERWGTRTLQPDEILRRNQQGAYNPNSKMVDPFHQALDRLMQQGVQPQFQVGEPQSALMQLLGNYNGR